MTQKRFKVAVYDEKAINGFTVLDLHKPNSSKRLKYENVYIGSKEGCDIVCKFGNELAEENEQLKFELDTHKHPLWSTREAERKVNELTTLLMNETKKNAILLEEINSLKIENMRLKELRND